MGCSSFFAFVQPVAAQKLVVGDTNLSISHSLNFSFSQFLILSSNNWDSFLIISELNPNFY